MRIFWEAIHEGHDGAAALDEPPPGVHVGDVGELILRDVQQAGQLHPVGAGLVPSVDKKDMGINLLKRIKMYLLLSGKSAKTCQPFQIGRLSFFGKA